MPTAKAGQPSKYHPKLYATSLKIKGAPRSLLLDVEAASAQQAAEAAADEWMGGKRCPDIRAGAAIYVRHYLLDGTVAPETLFRLDQESLEEARRKWAKRAVEKEKYNNQIEEYRRQTFARMKQHLAQLQMAEAELDALSVAFQHGDQDHPELKALVSLERPTLLRGSGALQFRGIARHAARAVGHCGGDDAWEHWIAILVGYLLENDDRGEYLTKQVHTSRSGDSEEEITEIYGIDRLFQASALCCSWLKAGMPASKKFSGEPTRKAVRRNPKYEAIDKALQSIAEARPRSHADVFDGLDGRCRLPNAEPFESAGGWTAGFRRDRTAARVWLSKNWARLKLPPFPRGPK